MNSKLPYRFRILVFLFFLIIITYLDRNAIALVGSQIKAEFGLSNQQFGWVLAAFSLAYALFEIPAGMMGDRIGQRAVFIRIVLLWSLFTVFTGLATGLVSLIIIRFLFGAGEAGVFPTAAGVIARWFPISETSRSVNVTTIGQTVSLMIAPLIIVPLAAHFGWRATFYINGVIGLLWVWVCYAWFRNHPSEMKGVSEEENTFITAHRKFNTQRPEFKLKSLFKSRSLLALTGIHFCANWGFYFFIAWLPIYLREGRNFSENDMKWTTSFMFAAGLMVVLFGGVLSDRLVKQKGVLFGRRFFGMAILGGTAIALLITGFTSSNTVVVISLVTAYLFFPLNNTTNYSTCVDIGGNQAGTVAGIMNFGGQIGGFFLSLTFGILADATHSFTIPVVIVAVVLSIGCLLWLLVDPTKQLVVD
jgi:ACS family glucarate transporter-like MFS transporter